MKINKKIIMILLIALLIPFLFSSNSYAVDITLEDIANEINNSTETKKFAKDGINISAETTENSLKMKMTISSDKTKNATSTYTLEGNILTNSNFVIEDEAFFSQVILAAINNLQGNKDIFATIHNKLYEGTIPYEKCTLEEDGIQYNINELKIDITKKLTPINYERAYFTEKEYNDAVMSVSSTSRLENSSVSLGDVFIFFTNEENYKNIDKSIPYLMEFIDGNKNDDVTGEKAYEYFKANCPSFEEGIKEFEGFNILTGRLGDIPGFESYGMYQMAAIVGLGMHSDTKVVYIEIDGEKIRQAVRKMNQETVQNSEAIKTEENNAEEQKEATAANTNTVDHKTVNSTKTKYPQAGLSGENLVYGLIVLIVISLTCIIILGKKK